MEQMRKQQTKMHVLCSLADACICGKPHVPFSQMPGHGKNKKQDTMCCMEDKVSNKNRSLESI